MEMRRKKTKRERELAGGRATWHKVRNKAVIMMSTPFSSPFPTKIKTAATSPPRYTDIRLKRHLHLYIV